MTDTTAPRPIDLIFINNRWHVRELDEKRSNPPFHAHFQYKSLALPAAVAIADKLNRELVIRKRNGQIQDRRSYGNDPSRRPG